MSLVTKKVTTKNIEFLQFLYSDYQPVKSLKQVTDTRGGIIYTGLVSDTNVSALKRMTSRYIIVSDFGEIRLVSVSDYIRYFFPKQESLIKEYELLPEEDFFSAMKVGLVLGKSLPSQGKTTARIFQLFESVVGSRSLMVKSYLSLLEDNEVGFIFSSFLTFLQRVSSKDWETVSTSYRSVLNRSSLKFGAKIPSALRSYINNMRSSSMEVALFNMLLELNG